MKTIKKISLPMVMVFLVSMGACEIMPQSDADLSFNEEYMAFEQSLNDVFVLAGDKLSAPGGNRLALADYFRSAFSEVFAEEADLAVFDLAFADMVEHRKRKESAGFTEMLVAASGTPEEALERIADVLAGDELEEELVIELLVVRQSILFMMEHHELLEPEKPSFSMSVMDGEHNDEGNRGGPNEEEDDADPGSWWTNWGSCAAGVIGSAGTGSVYGCSKGFTVGLLKGCAVGAVIGSVSGGLVGASTFCTG